MKWIVAPRIRAHIVGFTGVNFSGLRTEVDLFPTGTQKGDLEGDRLKCIGLIAPVGTRVILCASTAEDGWEALPWRAITVREGFTFESRDGRRVGVQIPDIDALDQPGALRTDLDFTESYPFAATLDAGEGWTFGRSGATLLKCNVRAIRVDRID